MGMIFDFHSDHKDVAQDQESNSSTCKKDSRGLWLRKTLPTESGERRNAYLSGILGGSKANHENA